MSTYNGRRAPNVSQYLNNLNAIPSQNDLAAQDFDFGNDGLDFLTNAEFFDFDASTFGANPVDFSQPVRASTNNGVPINVPGYQFSEFQTYRSPLAPSPPLLDPSLAQQPTYPHQDAQFSQALPSDKSEPAIDLEEQSRTMAEDDKRRRNTAASARFRVKKKQREQALEKQSKEMVDKVDALEGRVQQLEMENKWLKGLITEKHGSKGVEEQYKLFKAEQARQSSERSISPSKDGVGTEHADAKEAEV